MATEATSADLYLHPKMGLTSALTQRNYTTHGQKVREVVTNALDANASNVWVTITHADPAPDIWFADDGDGMSLDEFDREFLSVGGSQKYATNQIGRIGIGFLAVATLADEMTIFSRKRNSEDAFRAIVNLRQIMSEAYRRQDMTQVIVGKIAEVLERDQVRAKDLEPHFTKIHLTKLREEVLAFFQDPVKFRDFEFELRRILPIQYKSDSYIFERMASRRLRDWLLDPKNLKTINVYLNGSNLLREVYGNDTSEQDFYDLTPLENQRCDNLRVFGYLIDAGKTIKSPKWRGVTYRVKNVAVEENSYIGFEDGDLASRQRLTGEVHIAGLDDNDAINIDRSEFIKTSKDFKTLQKLMKENVRYLAEIRERSERKGEIQRQVKRVENAARTFRVFSKKVDLTPQDAQKIMRTQDRIARTARPLSERKRVDLLRDMEFGPGIHVSFLDELEGRGQRRKVQISWKKKKAEVKLSRKLWDEKRKKLKIGEDVYVCEFVDGRKDQDPCHIDLGAKKVFLNVNHPLVAPLEVDLTLVAIILRYSLELSRGDAQKMYYLAVEALRKVFVK